jgi:hypothetical protein
VVNLSERRPVAHIRYPFWLLLAENESPKAFSTFEKMGGFLEWHKKSEWSVRPINRYSITLVLKVLKEDGHTHICFDADTNESSSVSLNELNEI